MQEHSCPACTTSHQIEPGRFNPKKKSAERSTNLLIVPYHPVEVGVCNPEAGIKSRYRRETIAVSLPRPSCRSPNVRGVSIFRHRHPSLPLQLHEPVRRQVLPLPAACAITQPRTPPCWLLRCLCPLSLSKTEEISNLALARR